MEHIAITGIMIAGKSVFAHMIYDVYGLMKDATQHPLVQPVLQKLDLEADLKVIEALTNQLEQYHIPDGSPVRVCLNQVEELVKNIKDELEEITRIIREHYQLKWFSTWRTPDCLDNLDALVEHKKVLDMRVSRLIQLMNAIGYHPA